MLHGFCTGYDMAIVMHANMYSNHNWQVFNVLLYAVHPGESPYLDAAEISTEA